MSNSAAQSNETTRRSYRQDARARKQEETRQRIVDAAIELHCSVGPARTTVAEIAARAGVQRHTYYAHFPIERDLFLACSATALERDPLPAVEQWKAFPPGHRRVSAGLAELYGWYQRNSGQAACVLRDAEHHALTREMVELRMKPTMERAAGLLGDGFDHRARALLHVAMEFGTWRVLSASHEPRSAAALLADALTNLPAESAA
jgi:AcrR family transcriptional regulator